MTSTYVWLKEKIQPCNQETIIHRVGRSWIPVQGFSSCGCIFVIYKDTNNYCVHAGDEWNENEEPLLGYYDIHLSWDELLLQVANKYDSMKNKA